MQVVSEVFKSSRGKARFAFSFSFLIEKLDNGLKPDLCIHRTDVHSQ